MDKNEAIELAIMHFELACDKLENERTLSTDLINLKTAKYRQAISILESMKEAQNAPPSEAR